MSNPGKLHWVGMKWLLRYLVGTLNLDLVYEKRSETLKGYVDSYFAGGRDSRKSTTAYFFTLCDNCITWKSQLQPLVTLSSTEAEYVAITKVVKKCIWLKEILKELNFMHDIPIMLTKVHCHSVRTLFIMRDPNILR